MKKKLKGAAAILLAACLISACSQKSDRQEFVSDGKDPVVNGENAQALQEEEAGSFEYTVDPKTFELQIISGDKSIPVSVGGSEQEVENLITDGNKTTWEYPNLSAGVEVIKEHGYLQINIESKKTEEDQFIWPRVNASQYYLPFGEGVMIRKDDSSYKEYLKGQSYEGIESLSMQFFAVGDNEQSLVYIIDNPYNNTIHFQQDGDIRFDFEHTYKEITKNKKYGFRIYPTLNNPVSIAKIYRSYIIEKGRFKTLQEKETQNPNISKLYGAPQIYLWNSRILSETDIKWKEFLHMVKNGKASPLEELLSQITEGSDVITVFTELRNQDYVSDYQKNAIAAALSEMLRLKEFYSADRFHKLDETAGRLISRGVSNLNEQELIELNKHVLSSNFEEVFHPVNVWGSGRTSGLLSDMKASGMDRAWIGLDHWEIAYSNPDLISAALESGYLIAPYDSYHSIHEPGNEQWETAAFSDRNLYENGTVIDKNGNHIKGFQGVGRKLNPTLTLPAVKERVSRIIQMGMNYNSWFIDCDATGEVYDDYSEKHQTTQQEDLEARLQRMSYIRDEHNLVIGSEGGNDFASADIAYAQGIELQSFSWMDDDMKKNRESEYFIGKYYSPYGGVAEHFQKQIPVKEKYLDIFLNPTVRIPLYKLVYNDSIVTAYHWDWSTYKIKGETENRMLYEVLYNVPPLYHIDTREWEQKKESILTHTQFWSAFSRKVINLEMTNFRVLTEDRLVQETSYGDDIKVIVNYSSASFNHERNEIPAGSLVLYDGETTTTYTPSE